MTRALERRYGLGHDHFITFSCYKRQPFLAEPQARDLFETALETMRRRYGFTVDSYVVMPEHVHLLVSEPAEATLSVAVQALKISVARRSVPRPFWQRRFYDFNTFTDSKRLEKRRYMHRNPVARGLVPHPKDWRWSSYNHWATGSAGVVELASTWTFANRMAAHPAPAHSDILQTHISNRDVGHPNQRRSMSQTVRCGPPANATATSWGRQVKLGGLSLWSEDTAGNGKFLFQDHLGSTRITADASGNVKDDIDYTPFGILTANYGPGSDVHYQFTGSETDTESSTTYNTYRNLSMSLGRFHRPDPYSGSYDFTNPQSLNRYTYVLNNPMIFIDPTGLECQNYTLWYMDDGDETHPEAVSTDGNCQDGSGGDVVDPGYGGGTTVTADADPWYLDSSQGLDDNDYIEFVDPQVASGTGSAPSNQTPSMPPQICLANAMNTQLLSDQAAVSKAQAEFNKTMFQGSIGAPIAAGVGYGMGGNFGAAAIMRSFLAGVYVKAYAFTVPPLFTSMIKASSQYKKDAKSCGYQP